MKKNKSIFLIPFIVFKILKKTKIDNFVAGVVFGALISLLINIVTVKIQDTVSRQRALEAVERELTYHILDVNAILNQEKLVRQATGSADINIDGVMAKRFSTKVWDNTEIYSYLLEIDPEAASQVEIHYETIVKGLNRLLEENENYYQELYKPCRPFYSYLSGKTQETTEYCLYIQSKSIESQSTIAYKVLASMDQVKKFYHPTKDRLNNFWMSLLLGNRSVKILE
jgi:hypothetical protein